MGLDFDANFHIKKCFKFLYIGPLNLKSEHRSHVKPSYFTETRSAIRLLIGKISSWYRKVYPLLVSLNYIYIYIYIYIVGTNNVVRVKMLQKIRMLRQTFGMWSDDVI